MSEKHIFETAFDGLPKKIVESLMNSDYDSLEELHELSDKDLTKIKGIGKTSVNTIRALLATSGFEQEFQPDPEAVAAMAAGKSQVSKAEELPQPVRDVGSGKKKGRKRGQVVMLCNLVDHGFRRKNTGQKLQVVIGDVVRGNKDKQWDLPDDYVDMLIEKGDAA